MGGLHGSLMKGRKEVEFKEMAHDCKHRHRMLVLSSIDIDEMKDK